MFLMHLKLPVAAQPDQRWCEFHLLKRIIIIIFFFKLRSSPLSIRLQKLNLWYFVPATKEAKSSNYSFYRKSIRILIILLYVYLYYMCVKLFLGLLMRQLLPTPGLL